MYGGIDTSLHMYLDASIYMVENIHALIKECGTGPHVYEVLQSSGNT